MTKITCIPLDSLKTQLGLENATLTPADNDRLKTALTAATGQIEQITGRWIVPRRAIVNVGFDRPDELLLAQDLMELVSLTNGDGETISSEDIEFISPGVLRLLNGARFVEAGSGQAQPITLIGTWGWHDHWSEAWRQSGDSINGLLDPTGTPVIPVQDADGADPEGAAPRFKVGQLLRVNQEMMSVIGVNTGANTLTVLRGVQGTGTGVHAPGALITIYSPPAQVEMLILRWAMWLYKSPERGGAYSTIPLDLMDAARALRRVRVR
jgi:hypothetical protein